MEDLITINEEFKSIKSTIEEEIINNVLNIKFVIEDTDRFLWSRSIFWEIILLRKL